MATSTSFPKRRLKILFLEGVHPSSKTQLEEAGYQVEMRKNALSESELLDAIGDVHVLGIRSKTEVPKSVLEKGSHLLAIGCFCIGTNQVALDAAAAKGIPVFNAPFGNTRSVAELVMGEAVMLARRAAHKSHLMRQGVWEKSADGCMELRQKTMGIIGYGHIGYQVGVLAEAFGMSVLYYDVVTKLPMGNARPTRSLHELLSNSDFVTLHVPETPETINMIGRDQLQAMKKDSYLLNLSRGTIVDIPALCDALSSKHLAGAAVDVFPEEPHGNAQRFETPLSKFDNVILTPHIGGSTMEAQRNIGSEVVTSLFNFIEMGSTSGAVNFPQVELPVVRDSHRILSMQHNVPGALGKVNSIAAEMGTNIKAQYYNSNNDIGYLIMDVDTSVSRSIKERIDGLEINIKTRLLF